MRICTPYLNTYCRKWDGRWLDGKLCPIRSWCNQVWCEKLRRFRARFVSASVLKIAVGAKENFVCDFCIYLGVCGWLQMLSFFLSTLPPGSLLMFAQPFKCILQNRSADCCAEKAGRWRAVVQISPPKNWFKIKASITLSQGWSCLDMRRPALFRLAELG